MLIVGRKMPRLILCCSTALLFAIITFPGVWGRDLGESGVRVDTSKALFFKDSDNAMPDGIQKVGRDTIIDLSKRDIVSERTSSSSSASAINAGGERMRARRSGDDTVQSRSRRSVPTDFTAQDADAIVAKHNEGRGMVTPEAANMKTMEWDSILASMAQEWSNGCLYEHGNPTNISPFSSVGQNLYIRYGLSAPGTPPDGTRATEAWYNEYQYYNYEDLSCDAGQQCGHYTQNVWASTYAVGCGLKFCTTATDNNGRTYNGAWLITCNYGPAGNYVGTPPYVAGPSCTKCESGSGICKDNLCSDCSTAEDGCECRAACQNCATLNSDCTCTCVDGWYGADCGTYCENTHEYCGANPGWPTSWCDRSYVIAGCPLMCSICNAQDPSFVCIETTPAQLATSQPTSSKSTTLGRNPATQSQTTRGEIKPTTPTIDSLSTTFYDPVEATTPTTTVAATTPCPISMCLHDSALEEEICSCNCTRSYYGDICQHANTRGQNGALVLLHEDINDWGSIQINVLSALRTSVINYCSTRQSTCCPAANNTVIDFSSTGLTLDEEYPEETLDYSSASYWIQVTGISPVAPGVCRADDGGMLSADVVLDAIKQDETNLESSLSIDIGETKRSSAEQLVFSLSVILFNILLAFMFHPTL